MPGFIDHTKIKLAMEMQPHWAKIAKEANDLFLTQKVVPKYQGALHGQDGRNLQELNSQRYLGGNEVINLKVHKDSLDSFELEYAMRLGGEAARAKRCDLCPTVMSFVAPHWDKIGLLGFNRVYSGCKITPHFGVKSASRFARVHLGLDCDPGAKFFMTVNGVTESYTWKNGELMAFDDADTLHWVVHEGERPRTIMVIDIDKSLYDDNSF